MSAPPPPWLRLGVRVLDTATDRAGVAPGIGEPYSIEEEPSCVWLLPRHGGHEWPAAVADVRPIEEEGTA